MKLFLQSKTATQGISFSFFYFIFLFYFILFIFKNSLVAFLTRTALEYQPTFTSAVQFLKTYPIVADVYYTVAGTKSGEG